MIFAIVLIFAPLRLIAEDFEAGLREMTKTLTDLTTKAGIKRISVLDLTDLQGNNNELGRYIAEQLSVGLANSANGFSVMNRANLLSVLKEHKLTAEGLINPKTAREFGQFAGVDALVLGTITPLGDSLSITTQIIQTETAQIVGGKTARLARSKETDDLLSSAVTTRDGLEVNSERGGEAAVLDGSRPSFMVANSVCVFKDVSVRLRSFKLTPTKGILAVLEIKNLNKQNPVAVALNGEAGWRGDYVKTEITNNQGRSSYLEGCSGIKRYSGPSQGDQYENLMEAMVHSREEVQESRIDAALPSFTEIPAAQFVVVTLGFSFGNKEPGTVFDVSMELISVELGNNPRRKFSLNNVYLSGIRLQ